MAKKKKPTAAELFKLFKSLPMAEQQKFVDFCESDPLPETEEEVNRGIVGNAVAYRLLKEMGATTKAIRDGLNRFRRDWPLVLAGRKFSRKDKKIASVAKRRERIAELARSGLTEQEIWDDHKAEIDQLGPKPLTLHTLHSDYKLARNATR